jgi:hypothetical protein
MRSPDKYLLLEKKIFQQRKEYFKNLDFFRNTVFGNFLFFCSDQSKYAYIQNGNVSILGYGIFIEPNSAKTNQEIIADISFSKNIRELLKKIFHLAGRWVLFCKINGDLFAVGDASNSKQIYYYHSSRGWIFSSYEYLIGDIFELSKCKQASRFFEKFVMNKQKGDWWPGNSTIYAKVKALYPNHFFSCSKGKAIRFWPEKNFSYLSTEEVIRRSKKILTGVFFALTQRYKVALPVTGGLDSRLLFAASYSFREKIHYYVAALTQKGMKSKDVIIPKKLFAKLGVPFKIYNDPYKFNVNLASKFLEEFPGAKQETLRSFCNNMPGWPDGYDIILHGALNEVGSRYYWNRLFQINSEGLADLAAMRSQFAIDKMSEWFEEAYEVSEKTGYNILDLFYWEHRTGRWAAKMLSEYEFVCDPMFAFNSREYLDLIVRLKSKRKNFPDRKFLIDLAQAIEPKVFKEKEIGISNSLSECVVRFFSRTWLQKYLRKFYYFYQSKLLK